MLLLKSFDDVRSRLKKLMEMKKEEELTETCYFHSIKLLFCTDLSFSEMGDFVSNAEGFLVP